MNAPLNTCARLLLLRGLVWPALLVLLALWPAAARAQDANGQAGQPAPRSAAAGKLRFQAPQAVMQHGGQDDQRDADLYPAIAYDAQSRRYLAVWMSPRNAGSDTDAFDLYGRFLDANGQPQGSEFRISDGNSVARSGQPTVAAGDAGFVVAWTARGSPCRIYVQAVTDSAAKQDKPVNIQVSAHQHSPRLLYDTVRRRFVLVYVVGSDYLPPKLGAGSVADCGDAVDSSSQVWAADLRFDQGAPKLADPLAVSEALGGAFRPSIGYSAGDDSYVVAWEDRRGLAGVPNLFHVYAQRLDGDLTLTGNNIALMEFGDYTNGTAAATWTPRPAVAGGNGGFLVAWYTHEHSNQVDVWRLASSLLLPGGATKNAQLWGEMTLLDPAADEGPAGFVGAIYQPAYDEFLVATSAYLDTVTGYYSTVRLQRVDAEGKLLALDGTALASAGIGVAVDSSAGDQIGVALAANSSPQASHAYLLAYARHAEQASGPDFDIWSVRGAFGDGRNLYLPVLRK